MSNQLSVLFIDDDKFFLEFYSSEFVEDGFSVVLAETGKDGLVKAQSMLPSFILLDIILPDKDGSAILRELKENEETKHIPVVIISAFSKNQDVSKLFDLGAEEVFNKLKVLPKAVLRHVKNELSGGQLYKEEYNTPEDKVSHLSEERMNIILSEPSFNIQKMVIKLFDSSDISLEDFYTSIAPYCEFKKRISNLADIPGTIFIYGKIEANESGVAILAIKREEALTLIKFMESSVAGKKMGMTMKDEVVEEFFNIIVNSFLNKLSYKVPGDLALASPIIASSNIIIPSINEAGISDEEMVVLLNEAFKVKDKKLDFSLFVIFDRKLFQKL